MSDAKLIFEYSREGRSAHAQAPLTLAEADVPVHLRRQTPPALPAVSELQAVRHYTRLSQKKLLHRHPFLSAWVLYDEVQPACL